MDGYINTIVRKQKYCFEDWQENNMHDLGGDIIYKGQPTKNKEYLNYFYREIKNLVIQNDFTILNEKEFRNKVGTLLYRISE